MSTTQSLTWAVVVLAATASAAHAQDGSWQIGSTPSFSTGRYGTDTRTEIVYTPLTARKLFSDADLTLVVPFLCITGDGVVTVVNGTPLRQEVRPRAAATPGGRGGSDVRAGAATAPAPV